MDEPEQTTLPDAYTIRDFVETDRNFVLATWLRSLRAAPMYKFVPSDVFFPRMEPIVWRMMALHKVRIVHITGEDDHIVGWACGTPDYLDYVYVKRHTRSCGLVQRLLDDLGVVEPVRCTFWTHYAERFLSRWQYKPSLVEWV